MFKNRKKLLKMREETDSLLKEYRELSGRDWAKGVNYLIWGEGGFLAFLWILIVVAILVERIVLGLSFTMPWTPLPLVAVVITVTFMKWFETEGVKSEEATRPNWIIRRCTPQAITLLDADTRCLEKAVIELRAQTDRGLQALFQSTNEILFQDFPSLRLQRVRKPECRGACPFYHHCQESLFECRGRHGCLALVDTFSDEPVKECGFKPDSMRGYKEIAEYLTELSFQQQEEDYLYVLKQRFESVWAEATASN